MNPRRGDVIRRIAELKARLATLERERLGAENEIAALRTQLASLGPGSEMITGQHVSSPDPRTPDEKVKLFRSLFRGRADVFPTRFASKKTGKAGYAPACANKFVRGVCDLPRVKCGECPNQAFQVVDNQAVLGHLTGRHVMGVYSLLEDETCRQMGVTVSVERSRSGSGAHAWFFFTNPVAASVARRMGCYLITETMNRRDDLAMDSYDRLFPNQDTMPRGGFGNLIALPFQPEARNAGNTLFLDDHFEPYADQWAYLASVIPVPPTAVDAIAQEATF